MDKQSMDTTNLVLEFKKSMGFRQKSILKYKGTESLQRTKSSNLYIFGFQRYSDQKIRVCGKAIIPLELCMFCRAEVRQNSLFFIILELGLIFLINQPLPSSLYNKSSENDSPEKILFYTVQTFWFGISNYRNNLEILNNL